MSHQASRKEPLGAAAAAVARLERRARVTVAAREAEAAGGERKQPKQRRGALEPQSEPSYGIMPKPSWATAD